MVLYTTAPEDDSWLWFKVNHEADQGENPHPMKVLVVDDQHDVANTLAELLCLEGFEASAAYSADTALVAVRECIPDVVICDLAMPHRGGLSLCREVRDWPELRSTHFIAYTAYGDPEHSTAAAEAGFDDFVVKGEPDPLLSLLQRIAEERQGKRPG